jgi:hypothetical protein
MQVEDVVVVVGLDDGDGDGHVVVVHGQGR